MGAAAGRSGRLIPPSDPCGETLVDRLPTMMMPLMQKMAAPLSLASALCHVATVAVMMNMHIQLSTVQDTATGPGQHRTLLDSDSAHDPLVMDPLAQTVARLEKAADTHGVRLTAVENGHAQLTAVLKVQMEGHEGAGHGGARRPTAGAQLFQNTTGDDIQAQLRSLQRRDDELQTSIRELAQDHQRRGLQGAEPEPEPEIGENVKIIKPQVVRCGGPGGTTSDGTFDYARCASDPAFATCHAEACAGHRRAQAGDGYGEGTCPDLESHSAEVTQVCCDEPEEDCTGGYPHTCNAGCAATFLPFWEECRSALGKSSSSFEPVVALCTASAGTSSHATRPSLTEQLNLQCTDGTAAAECVPECSERYHGFLMLLSIEGEDSKLSCELHHGLYSWAGAAADGGYIGQDVQSFCSAVTSGAAGFYAVTVTEDAGIGTDLTIQPGMNVQISGDMGLNEAPRWGSGIFAVREVASLSLNFVLLGEVNTIAFANSSRVTLSSLVLPSGAWLNSRLQSMTLKASSKLTLNAVTIGNTFVSGTSTMQANDHGQLAYMYSSTGLFFVISGPCTSSQGGLCVGRRYDEENPWPSADHGGGIIERCEIGVLGAGVLGPTLLFDTVSYSPATGVPSNVPYSNRHDMVGLGGARCDSCATGTVGYPTPDEPHCPNCYAGTNGPPAGAKLVPGELLTWVAAGDYVEAFTVSGYGIRGDPANHASAHEGWKLCFA